jgi:hypothetical protein
MCRSIANRDPLRQRKEQPPGLSAPAKNLSNGLTASQTLDRPVATCLRAGVGCYWQQKFACLDVCAS